jgi:hypothetical protein
MLSACGDEAAPGGVDPGDAAKTPAPAGGPPEDWSPPAVGDVGAVLTDEQAAEAVEQMLASPKTLRSEAWGTAVRRLTQILWPIATGETPPQAARTHEQVARIAKSMAAELDSDPLLGESLEGDRRIEYEIHNRYRAALTGSPGALRTFCETEGEQMLRAHAKAMQARFFGTEAK